MVNWEDTGEPISAYRSRVRAETPVLIQVWRYGLGLVVGGGVGTGLGLLIALAAPPPRNMALFAIIGALVGAFLVYMIGTITLNRVFGIDYRRMR
jgi:hypothetical protein